MIHKPAIAPKPWVKVLSDGTLTDARRAELNGGAQVNRWRGKEGPLAAKLAAAPSQLVARAPAGGYGMTKERVLGMAPMKEPSVTARQLRWVLRDGEGRWDDAGMVGGRGDDD